MKKVANIKITTLRGEPIKDVDGNEVDVCFYAMLGLAQAQGLGVKNMRKIARVIEACEEADGEEFILEDAQLDGIKKVINALKLNDFVLEQLNEVLDGAKDYVGS